MDIRSRTRARPFDELRAGCKSLVGRDRVAGVEDALSRLLGIEEYRRAEG